MEGGGNGEQRGMEGRVFLSACRRHRVQNFSHGQCSQAPATWARDHQRRCICLKTLIAKASTMALQSCDIPA